MKKINLIPTLFAIAFLFFLNNTHAQDFSKNSIKLGLGVGASMGGTNDGAGFMYSAGFQREMWKDKLRFNPNFRIGRYSSWFIQDARDQYFNSINVEANLYFDLIKIKAFSLVVGTGALANTTRGLIGTGGEFSPQESEYLRESHFGGYLGGGIRINPANKQVAINIMPLNFHMGNDYFTEFHAKIELDIKL